MNKILVIFLLLPGFAHACFWVHGTTIDGNRTLFDGFTSAAALNSVIAETPEGKWEQLMLYMDFSNDDGYSGLEAEGVKNALMGNYEEAIRIFQGIEASEPGRYSTASNLGTAYELIGDLPQALYWINECIRLNPESHYGTEWIHRRILDAKIELQANPDYLLENHVLPLPDRMEPDYIFVDGHSEYSLEEIREALLYQLRERLIFVKPPDPVVADLLYSYAIAEANSRSVESGVGLLELALVYGYPDSHQLSEKMSRYHGIIYGGYIRYFGKILLIVLAAIAFLVYSYKKKWFFISSRDYNKHKQAQLRAHMNLNRDRD